MKDFKKNDIVRFLPGYEDGKPEFDYILIEDPDDNRVKVKPLNTGLKFPPIQVVDTNWLKKKKNE
jgi:hypothetical protein